MTSFQSFVVVVASVALVACGGDDTPASTVPAITITSPAANATVTPAADKSVAVAFTTANFTLEAAGTAGCGAGCGHIHVLVDGANCTPAGAPYNNDSIASPAEALLASCPAVTGSHTITLELHNNDHSPVNDAAGKVISANVTITAQ